MKNAEIIASNKGRDIDPVPAGLHPAVCVGLYSVGTHLNPTFATSSKKLIIAFEFPLVEPLKGKDDDDKEVLLPRMLSRRLTLSMNPKGTLRPLLVSWRGREFTEAEAKAFDVTKLIGVSATVQVIQKSEGGRVFSSINNILPYKGPKLEAKLPKCVFSVSQLERAAELADAKLPGWIEELVKESEEFLELLNPKPKPEPMSKEEYNERPQADPNDPDDDLPF